MIAAGLSGASDLKQNGQEMAPPPKLVDSVLEVVELKKPPSALDLERKIACAYFAGKTGRAAVIKPEMRKMRRTLESLSASTDHMRDGDAGHYEY